MAKRTLSKNWPIEKNLKRTFKSCWNWTVV